MAVQEMTSRDERITKGQCCHSASSSLLLPLTSVCVCVCVYFCKLMHVRVFVVFTDNIASVMKGPWEGAATVGNVLRGWELAGIRPLKGDSSHIRPWQLVQPKRLPDAVPRERVDEVITWLGRPGLPGLLCAERRFVNELTEQQIAHEREEKEGKEEKDGTAASDDVEDGMDESKDRTGRRRRYTFLLTSPGAMELALKKADEKENKERKRARGRDVGEVFQEMKRARVNPIPSPPDPVEPALPPPPDPIFSIDHSASHVRRGVPVATHLSPLAPPVPVRYVEPMHKHVGSSILPPPPDPLFPVPGVAGRGRRIIARPNRR
jgi:hypothetical protein